jgi:hypothetical protein
MPQPLDGIVNYEPLMAYLQVRQCFLLLFLKTNKQKKKKKGHNRFNGGLRETVYMNNRIGSDFLTAGSFPDYERGIFVSPQVRGSPQRSIDR